MSPGTGTILVLCEANSAKRQWSRIHLTLSWLTNFPPHFDPTQAFGGMFTFFLHPCLLLWRLETRERERQNKNIFLRPSSWMGSILKNISFIDRFSLMRLYSQEFLILKGLSPHAALRRIRLWGRSLPTSTECLLGTRWALSWCFCVHYLTTPLILSTTLWSPTIVLARYRWGNQATDWFRDMPKVTQQGSRPLATSVSYLSYRQIHL